MSMPSHHTSLTNKKSTLSTCSSSRRSRRRCSPTLPSSAGFLTERSRHATLRVQFGRKQGCSQAGPASRPCSWKIVSIVTDIALFSICRLASCASDFAACARASVSSDWANELLFPSPLIDPRETPSIAEMLSCTSTSFSSKRWLRLLDGTHALIGDGVQLALHCLEFVPQLLILRI